MSKPTQYVAFLRAINVGGHQIISKTDLVKAFEDAGFTAVRTVIQSGNVLFEATAAKPATLTAKVQKSLKTVTGHDLTIMIRPLKEIQELVENDPFGEDKTKTDTTTYVAFLDAEPKSAGMQKLSDRQTEKDKVIFTATESIHLVTKPKGDKNRYTTDFIEKDLAVKATVRNWNTVLKIAALCEKSDKRQA